MALIPGTLPAQTNFPGTPQALLNLFSSYLSAPPSSRQLFVQPTSVGVPTDGTALWYNTGSNTLNVYSNGSWNTPTVANGAISASSIATGAVTTNAIATGAITTSTIALGSVTPGLLSAGAPSWTTQGNLTVTGNVVANKFYGDGTSLTLPAAAQAIPSGAILPFAFNTTPTGWLICDGNAYSRSTYSALWTALGQTASPYGQGDGSTTFNVPDLRGQFIRGFDGGTITAAFGVKQSDALQGHSHNATSSDSGHAHGGGAHPGQTNAGGSYGQGSGAQIWSGGGGGNTDANSANITTTITTIKTDGTNGTPRTSAETRPVNIAMLYCIKA